MEAQAKKRQRINYKDKGIRWSPPSLIKTDAQMLEYITTKTKRTEDGCLLWVGWTTRDGYPRLNWKKKTYRANRLVYRLTHENMVASWLVRTTCGNPTCVNPEHLVQISRGNLNKKMGKEGSFPRGLQRSIIAAKAAKNPRLGMDKAKEVARMRAEGMYYKDIGAVYGVRPEAVFAAVKRWTKAGLI